MANLGADDGTIEATEREMGLCFPDGLKAVWRVSNGLELPGGWQVFPVFDPSEPRKTSNHIGYENTKGRWSYMNESLIAIAAGDTGNRLVLKVRSGIVEDTIYLWDHERNSTRSWGRGFDYLLAKAWARVTWIDERIARSPKRKSAKRPPPRAD